MLHEFIRSLARVLTSGVDPATESFAETLDLDMRAARITRTSDGILAITGATWLKVREPIDLLLRPAAPKSAHAVFPSGLKSFTAISDENFGDDQRVEASRAHNGYTVLFKLDGCSCGINATKDPAQIESVFFEIDR